MSGGFQQPNPFQPSHPFGEANPYSSPAPSFGGPSNNLRDKVKGKVMAPAIFLLIVAVLGMLITGFNAVFAMVSEPPPVDPNAPEFVRQMQRGMVGPGAVVLQAAFFVLNIVILLGAIQMIGFKSRTMGIVAAVLAMVNFGSCCCIIGLPAGIWSLIVLVNPEVKAAFDASVRG